MRICVSKSQMTLYKLGVTLPCSLPIESVTDLSPFDDNIVNKIHYVFAEVNAGKQKQYKKTIKKKQCRSKWKVTTLKKASKV